MRWVCISGKSLGLTDCVQLINFFLDTSKHFVNTTCTKGLNIKITILKICAFVLASFAPRMENYSLVYNELSIFTLSETFVGSFAVETNSFRIFPFLPQLVDTRKFFNLRWTGPWPQRGIKRFSMQRTLFYKRYWNGTIDGRNHFVNLSGNSNRKGEKSPALCSCLPGE